MLNMTFDQMQNEKRLDSLNTSGYIWIVFLGDFYSKFINIFIYV